jgi:signal transduction histidine kinase
VLVIDHQLGGVLGHEYLQQLRRRGHDQPTIYLTGTVDAFVTERSLEAGADEYLCKDNLSPACVQQSLSRAMARASQRREVAALHATAARAAREAAAAKERFLAMVSHELRTPLTAILGLASLSLEAEGDCREEMATILTSSRAMLRLVEDLLDAAQLDGAAFRLNPQPTPVASLTREVSSLVRPLAQASELELVVAADDADLSVNVDGSRIVQVLVNLATNAVKYTPSGRVRIHLHHCGTHLHGSVEDTGPGMSEDELARVVEPFERGNGAAVRAAGTGLGLSITKQLIERMGGSLDFESTVGVGTTARFAVPCPAVRPPRASPSEFRPQRSQGSRVLLVDDNPVNLKVLERMVSRTGCRVTTASCPLEALDALGREQFELVITDQVMPQMTGLELIATLRRQDRQDVPSVCLLTANALDEQLRRRCHDVGCFEVATKPISPSEIERLVARALEGRRQAVA